MGVSSAGKTGAAGGRSVTTAVPVTCISHAKSGLASTHPSATT
jgi:hypothetical protein